MLIRIYPENPNEKAVRQVTDLLASDGVVIYPTDSVYAIACSLASPKGLDRLKSLTGRKDTAVTILCADLAQAAEYAKISNAEFRILKRNLPGPFTFILNASSRMPDKALARRKTVGLRISSNGVAEAIVTELGHPLATCSLKSEDEMTEYLTDPELINEEWGEKVDMVIDGGYGALDPTTVVDLTGEEPEVIREGIGELKMVNGPVILDAGTGAGLELGHLQGPKGRSGTGTTRQRQKGLNGTRNPA